MKNSKIQESGLFVITTGSLPEYYEYKDKPRFVRIKPMVSHALIPDMLYDSDKFPCEGITPTM